MKRRAVLATASLVLLLLGGVYWLTTGPGQELLRVQAEHVLSDLLRGEVRIGRVELIFHRGLGLRGHDVSVYPSAGGPGMHADVATVELRETALLAGDIDLASLVVERLRIRAILDEDGVWSYPPLRALQDSAPDEDSGDIGPVLAVFAGVETVSRFILEQQRIADEIVIHRGSIDFEDHSLDPQATTGADSRRFRLEGIEARLQRPWPSSRGELSLSGTFTGPGGRSLPVRWNGEREDESVEVAVEIENLDLDVLDGYVKRWSRDADLDGSLSARIEMQSQAPGFQKVRIEATLTDVVPTIALDEGPLSLSFPIGRFDVRAEVEPQIVRLLDATLTGPRVSAGIEGRIERPVGRDSMAHFETWVKGVAIEDVGPIVDQLPRRSVDAIHEWFDRLTSGTVDELALEGTTRLSQWGALARGNLERLPQNFLLRLRVSNVTAQLSEDDSVTEGAFRADWSGDRLEFRKGRGKWRGEDLAEISVTIDGFSRLVEMRESRRSDRAQATPGLSLLWDLLLAEPADDSPKPTPSRFAVEIDSLDHPLLRWPVENARLVVTPTATGSEAQVIAATWGGQPIVAEVLYQLSPTPRISVGLEAIGPASKRADPPASGSAPGPAPEPSSEHPNEWGQGRFALEPHEAVDDADRDLLSKMEGAFRLVGSEIRLSEVNVALTSDARMRADLTLDLGDPERVGVDFSGQLVDTSCDELGQLTGLPGGFVTGDVDLFIDIDGTIAPGQSPYAGLRGTLNAAAKDGEIRQSIPVAVALATATDGFNPFAKRESLHYDTIEAEIVLRDGVLTAQRFELEGPVRVYATGTLDFREPPYELDAVVGVFLLQRVREFLGRVPLVDLVLPGSKHGFVGAYFRIHGDWDEPQVSTMAMKSLQEELPDLIAMPFEVIQWLWSSEPDTDDASRRDEASKQ